MGNASAANRADNAFPLETPTGSSEGAALR